MLHRLAAGAGVEMAGQQVGAAWLAAPSCQNCSPEILTSDGAGGYIQDKVPGLTQATIWKMRWCRPAPRTRVRVSQKWVWIVVA